MNARTGRSLTVRQIWPLLAATAIVLWCAIGFCAAPTYDPTYERLTVGAERNLFAAINEYRVQRRLPPLSIDPILMNVARQRVDSFSHNHPRHGWVKDHARRAGFKGVCTDNLAQGYPTPESAVGNARSGWGDESSRSIGHDKQMKGFAKVNGRWVNYHFDRVGVAVKLNCVGRTCRPTYIAIFGVKDSK